MPKSKSALDELRELASRDDARLGGQVLVPVALIHRIVCPKGFDAQVALSPEAIDEALEQAEKE